MFLNFYNSFLLLLLFYFVWLVDDQTAQNVNIKSLRCSDSVACYFTLVIPDDMTEQKCNYSYWKVWIAPSFHVGVSGFFLNDTLKLYCSILLNLEWNTIGHSRCCVLFHFVLFLLRIMFCCVVLLCLHACNSWKTTFSIMFSFFSTGRGKKMETEDSECIKHLIFSRAASNSPPGMTWQAMHGCTLVRDVTNLWIRKWKYEKKKEKKTAIRKSRNLHIFVQREEEVIYKK